MLDPTFTISKTLQQRNTIPNSAGIKKLKEMNMLKQLRDNNNKKKITADGIFISPWSRVIFWYFCPQLLRAKENVMQNSVMMHEVNKELFQWGEWHAMSGNILSILAVW